MGQTPPPCQDLGSVCYCQSSLIQSTICFNLRQVLGSTWKICAWKPVLGRFVLGSRYLEDLYMEAGTWNICSWKPVLGRCTKAWSAICSSSSPPSAPVSVDGCRNQRQYLRRIFGEYRARCAPVMDTAARSTLYSVPRTKLRTACTVAHAGSSFASLSSTGDGVIMGYSYYRTAFQRMTIVVLKLATIEVLSCSLLSWSYWSSSSKPRIRPSLPASYAHFVFHGGTFCEHFVNQYFSEKFFIGL